MNIPLTFVATALLSLCLRAGENREFGYWSTLKTGSWVKLKMEVDVQGVKIVVEATHTLIETGADKVIVEQKTTVTAAGQAQPEKVEKEEILKDKEKEPIKIEKEGDEDVEVNGKKLACHWIEGTQKETTKIKLWLSKEIPGGVAKGEVSGGEIPGVMKISAAGWEKK
jgi:hypothetical protein